MTNEGAEVPRERAGDLGDIYEQEIQLRESAPNRSLAQLRGLIWNP